MKRENIHDAARPGSRRRATGLAAAAITVALSAAPALSQSAIDPDADAILHAMADKLKGMASFSAEYDTDHEIVDRQGQKLQYSASGTIAVSRPSGLRVTRIGPYSDTEVVFDGKVVSLYGKALNAYAQIDSPGPSIDEAVDEFRMSTGLDAVGADLLAADPYPLLMDGVVSGSLVGTSFVGGVECDHLAFRNDRVDWQIWISADDRKLPLKYVITTKWVTGAPQYTLRLRDWNTDKVDDKQFSFTPPADAKKLDAVYSDAVGDLVLEAQE
ncbi:DUF2092 domain-containing protein [Rhizobium sp. WYCCWR 11279]|uniref:DUF2092 domain-containing protein n=1 Tax=Rhizobium changzhiense TaxID=2692317 RepID=UPI001491629A|nr:DUF2092 domain-containing protein [Rhizobium changzhiense]NNU47597.1 DUF2092 domain-containing protein [Rhizobium changzhiense]